MHSSPQSDASKVVKDFHTKYEIGLQSRELKSKCVGIVELNVQGNDGLVQNQYGNHTVMFDQNLSEEPEEIKVYILEDDLLLAGNTKATPYDSYIEEEEEDRREEDEEKENGGGKVSEYAPHHLKQVRETELKHCQLANRLSATLKCVFEEEGVTDVSSQMKVMTLAMENLGLHASFLNKKDT